MSDGIVTIDETVSAAASYEEDEVGLDSAAIAHHQVVTRSEDRVALKAARDRLRSLLRTLGANWDGYGARMPVTHLYASGLTLLQAVMGPEDPSPSIVPLPSGAVQFEWSTARGELEIEVLGSTRFEVYFEGGDMEVESTMTFRDLDRIADFLQRLRSPR